MCDEQKKSNNRPNSNEWKEDLRRGRWRREKMTGPSIFISKTFEILEVNPIFFRVTPTHRLQPGMRKEPISPFQTWIASSRRSCQSISGIEIFHPLSGSSTCMISTKFGTSKIRTSSSTDSSEGMLSNSFFIQTPPQKHQKKRMFQQKIYGYC